MADGATSRPATEVVDVVVDRAKPAVEGFLGFGCEWDPLFWHDFNRKAGVTEQDWALVRRRVEFMRLPIVRMMMQTRWCYREGGRFDWESQEMKSLYAHLDICQAQGISVILADWGVETWAPAAGIKDTADPAYAEAIGAYLEHLLKERGYTCIRYFILVNEPNYEVKDFDRWAHGLRNVAAVLKKRGLDKRIGLLGPDAGQGDLKWFQPAVQQLHDLLAGYDIHMYAGDKMVRPGQLEPFFASRWSYVREQDPDASAKIRVVGEAGLNDDAVTQGNRGIGTFKYGLFMADYAIQAAAAGSHAVSAWMLDDTNHEGFYWGLWADKKGGLQLRPWFFTWSLLCRYYPVGSTLYRLDVPMEGVRVLAGRLDPARASASGPAGRSASTHPAWTFCVVNRNEQAASLRIRVPGGPKAIVRPYVYQEGHLLTDKNGFPRPEPTLEADLAAGLPIACPAGAAMILTTIDP